MDEDPLPYLPRKPVLTPERIKLWNDMIFSWGFRAGEKGKKPLPEILEVPELAKVYAEGYYVAKLLNLIQGR